MKYRIISLLLMLSFILCGCQSSNKKDQLNNETTTEESQDDYNYYGDDYLFYDDYYTEDYYAEDYTETEYTEYETDEDFEPYELKIERNEVMVWSEPGYLSGDVLYKITDRRTVTIVDETVIYESGKNRVWGKLNTGGWISITTATYVEAETTEAATNKQEETTKKKKNKKKNNTTVSQTEVTTATSPQEEKPQVTSVTVEGVTFNYVKSYDHYFEAVDQRLKYDVKLDIKYCKPSDYMTGNERIVGISRSDHLYEKNEIGSVYYSAGTDDFAMFEIKVSGSYSDDGDPDKYIEFRNYNHAGILLKNIANGVTDYILFQEYANSGNVNKTYYMGVFKSEVARVDFKIFGVGPNGFGEW